MNSILAVYVFGPNSNDFFVEYSENPRKESPFLGWAVLKESREVDHLDFSLIYQSPDAVKLCRYALRTIFCIRKDAS